MFAVWGYVIANMRPDVAVGAQVEINPKLLAFTLGEDPLVVEGVIKKLCEPDLQSTSKAEEGRRLVKIGEFSYRVVNGAKYMAIKNEEERRDYFRAYKRKQRAKPKVVAAGEKGLSIREIVQKRVREDPITKADAAVMAQKWSEPAAPLESADEVGARALRIARGEESGGTSAD